MSKLTDKQKFFCREYLKDFNATQAAIRAGYSSASARQVASDNMSKHDIQQYIQKLSDDLIERTDNDIRRIINELQIIAFGSLKDVAEWDDLGLRLKKSEDLDDEARTVSEITRNVTEFGTSIKLKQHDKLRGLELLGKYHKIFTDKDNTAKDPEIKVTIGYDRGEQ